MDFWQIYILAIILIYLIAFFYRNLKTYHVVGESIRGRSFKLTLSLVLSTIIYIGVIINLLYPETIHYLGYLSFINHNFIEYAGYIFIGIALMVGIAALTEMKTSWRVGIKYDQKTKLITEGIYSFSRNPYFLSYDLLFLGFFLIYPSLILGILVIGVMVTFHQMIIDEESYLGKVHGDEYQSYRNRTGRYLNFF